MRVFEESAASTSCAIMSEDKGLNGTGSDTCSNKNNSVQTAEQSHGVSCDWRGEGSASGGGRLKFYKDGKFILELSHRREGEKMSWIPVPKKTYWPPPGTSSTVTTGPRQESTASLSASDDNSSVQLSPWQRDHCWKQTSPRKAASLEMTFVMVPLPGAFHVRRLNRAVLKRKRRRPFEPIDRAIDLTSVANLNGFQRIKSCAMKSSGIHLDMLVRRLWDCVKSVESPQLVQKHSASMFSPRKRMLREMERVSLVASSQAEEQVQVNPNLNLKRQRPKAPNGGVCQQSSSSGKGVSSYSITSLLGTKDEACGSHASQAPPEQEPSVLRNLLRSPKDEASREPSPKSRKNSPLQSRTSPPSPPAASYGPSVPSVHPLSYVHHPMLYPSFLSPHPQSPVAHHSYYSNISPYRGSPSHSPHLWGVPFPVSSLPHGGLLPPYGSHGFHFPWHTPTSTDVKREDTNSDVPLNLSKNAG